MVTIINRNAAWRFVTGVQLQTFDWNSPWPSPLLRRDSLRVRVPVDRTSDVVPVQGLFHEEGAEDGAAARGVHGAWAVPRRHVAVGSQKCAQLMIDLALHLLLLAPGGASAHPSHILGNAAPAEVPGIVARGAKQCCWVAGSLVAHDWRLE